MNRWASRNPEAMDEIARMPARYQQDAMRDAVGLDFDRIRDEDENCLCATSEPDEFGNRDLIENLGCPLHGPGIVQIGKKFERTSGPALTAEVVEIADTEGWVLCRLRRPSGYAFRGLRPVPIELLGSAEWRPIRDRMP